MATRRVNTISQLIAAARAARVARGWTQEELASRIGSNRRWVSEFEAGKSTVEFDYVLRVLNVLGIDLVAHMPDTDVASENAE